MSVKRPCQAFCCTFVLLLAISAGLSYAAAQKPPQTIAKAPPPETPPPPPSGRSLTPGPRPLAPAAKAGLKVAQAAGGSSATSAADLLAQALDYDWYNDPAPYQQSLEAALAAEPTSPSAGFAAALLASAYAQSNPARAALLSGQVGAGAYGSEPQTFSTLFHAMSAADTAQQYQAEADLLSSAMEGGPGTFTGGWAALNLGVLYRYHLGGSEVAAQFYTQVAASGGAAAPEAAVALADTVSAGGQDPNRAVTLAQAALASATQDRFRRRALLALANAQQDLGENRDAIAAASLVIAQWPDHPAALVARLKRAECAFLLGDLDTAAADGTAYLAYPDCKPLSVAFVHSVLGNKAFKEGDLAGAEAQFTTITNSIQDAASLYLAYQGLAECRSARGDFAGALAYRLKQADCGLAGEYKARALYAAAVAAKSAGNQASYDRIVARLVAEFPGSSYTTQLVGHEILPPPAV